MRASITAVKGDVVADIDPRLYGSFIEHLGRAIYGGIHDPGHPTADAQGFRGDVIGLVRDLDLPVVRYPGGNFVSAYNWEDGIGPVAERPVRLDLAWHTSESNIVGIHEFADWARAVGTQMMLAVNLGSRGLDAARGFLEYVNHPGGTAWSDLRRANGQETPWNVRLWCLGNEMDGPWQIGQKSADEYGRLAFETAKAMRAFDPAIELVVCGSSNPRMASYPAWEATVLDHTYEVVDYISLHMYFENHAGNTAEYLGMTAVLDDYIATVAGVIDMTRAKKRSARKVGISFDEWNVWYHSKAQDRAVLDGRDGWPHAPALLEDMYNFEDALLVGCILNTFLRRADVVRIACLAQLVNVIAPIMTVPGGPAWRQATYYPFQLASYFGRGTSLRLRTSSPGYATAASPDVPYVDAAGTVDAAGNVTLFVINRHQTENIVLDLTLEGFGELHSGTHVEMAGHDLHATNGPQDDAAISPKDAPPVVLAAGRGTVALAPLSYRMLRFSV